MVWKKGNKPWNTGKKISIKTRRKISLTQKEAIKNGRIPNRKGKHHSEETKRKLSKSVKGFKHTEESRIKISKSQIGVKFSEEHKLKLREARIKYIKKTSIDGRVSPKIGKFEKQIIDNIEKALNVKFIRQYQVCGYFLDGYNPLLNIVVEVNEYHHFDRISLVKSKKDETRKKNIIKELGCKWIDIDISRQLFCKLENLLKR